MTDRSGSILSAASALFGPIIWAMHFLVVYTSESLLCRLADGQVHTLLLVGATILASLPLLAHAGRQWHHLRTDGTPRFVARTALALDSLSLVAILLVAVAGLLLAACT